MARALEFPEASPKLAFSQRGEVTLAMSATNEVIELGELQVELLKSFDGKTELAEIARRLSEKYGEEVKPEDIAEFLPAAKKLGLLSLRYAGPADEEVARARCRRVYKALMARRLPPRTGESIVDELSVRVMERLRAKDASGAIAAAYALQEMVGDTSWIKQLLQQIESLGEPRSHGEMTPGVAMFALEDPKERLLFLDRWLGWLYTPLGAIVWFALVATGFYVRSGMNLPATSEVLNPLVAITLYVYSWCGGLFHEYSHALTCTHFGQPVRRIGIGLIGWLLPIFWADITPSYLIPQRWKRMLVISSGVMGSFLFMSLLTMLSMLLPPGNPIRQGVLVGVTLDVVNMAVNCVPFGEFDGYFFMSEWLHETNLKSRARTFSFALIGKFFAGNTVELPEEPPRSRPVLVCFTLGRLGWFAFMYSWVAGVLYENLVAPWRGYGLTILVLIAFFAVGRKLVELGAQAVQFLLQHLSAVIQPRNLLRVAVFSALAVAALFFIPMQESAEASFVLAPIKKAEVRAAIDGQIEEVLVNAGDKVRAGQPLARLVNREVTHALISAEAEVAQATAALARLEAGATDQEKEASRAAQRAEYVGFAAASADAQRSGALHSDGLITAADDEASRLKRTIAAGKLGQAEATARLVEAGSRREDVLAARARLTQAQTALELVKGEIDKLVVTSPIDGVVAENDTSRFIGKMVERGEKIMIVQNDERYLGELVTPWVPDAHALVQSRARLYLPTGQTVDVEISNVAMKVAANEPVSVETAPFKADGIVPGMAGKARLYGGRVPIAVAQLWHPVKRFFVGELWASL